MGLHLRSEQPGDEAAIEVVTCRAFESMDEAYIIQLLREYYPGSDRQYSVTAWDGDEIVGHALFTPAPIRLMGETVRALALGPIAVVPQRQKQGVGGRLLEFGQDLGRQNGFDLVFLNGHPGYYPRYGYEACFGFAKVTIDTDQLPEPRQQLRCMPVTAADVPWLVERHAAEWADVDFAWIWGDVLSEWRIPCINSMVWWTEDGRRVAYTMSKPGRNKCDMLLAEDPEDARNVIASVRPPMLEHHPAGWLARKALADVEWATVEARPSGAALAFELKAGVLDEYRRAVASGERLPGVARWPLPFVAC